MILCSSAVAYGQQTNRIQSKNLELQRIKSEIDKLQKDIDAISLEESESLEVLDKLKGQRLYLNKLLNKINKEIGSLNSEIKKTDREIERKSAKIDLIRENYKKYITWFYKNGMKNSELKYLVDSKSLNQAVMRYRYLSYLNTSNADIINLINEETTELKILQDELGSAKRDKTELAAQKKSEKKLLDRKTNEKESLLAKLKKNKKNISEEIELKRQAEDRITIIIAKLIENERNRLDGYTSTDPDYDYDYSYDKFEEFMSLKGRLNWPVKSGKVIRKFGKNKNVKLKTVTINYGVDILTTDNTQVHSVAEGVVSAIDWIPGYGSVIIVTHRDSYRTVYGHLGEILVSEGDEIKGGDIIGTVDKSLEGSILHFEIWKERDHQNPETWLVSK
jgi:septal ring factor EnvC (AmiA/AmiB activator)